MSVAAPGPSWRTFPQGRLRELERRHVHVEAGERVLAAAFRAKVVAEGHLVERGPDVPEEGVVCLADEDLAAPRQVVNLGRHDGGVAGREARADVVRPDRNVAHENGGLAVLDPCQRVRLAGAGDAAERPEARARVLEREAIGDVRLRVTGVVDLDLVPSVSREAVPVRSRRGLLERDPVRHQRDGVRFVGTDERVEVGDVNRRILRNQGRLPVARRSGRVGTRPACQRERESEGPCGHKNGGHECLPHHTPLLSVVESPVAGARGPPVVRLPGTFGSAWRLEMNRRVEGGEFGGREDADSRASVAAAPQRTAAHAEGSRSPLRRSTRRARRARRRGCARRALRPLRAGRLRTCPSDPARRGPRGGRRPGSIPDGLADGRALHARAGQGEHLDPDARAPACRRPRAPRGATPRRAARRGLRGRQASRPTRRRGCGSSASASRRRCGSYPTSSARRSSSPTTAVSPSPSSAERLGQPLGTIKSRMFAGPAPAARAACGGRPESTDGTRRNPRTDSRVRPQRARCGRGTRVRGAPAPLRPVPRGARRLAGDGGGPGVRRRRRRAPLGGPPRPDRRRRRSRERLERRPDATTVGRARARRRRRRRGGRCDRARHLGAPRSRARSTRSRLLARHRRRCWR